MRQRCDHCRMLASAKFLKAQNKLKMNVHPNRISWETGRWRSLWSPPLEVALPMIQIESYEYLSADPELARREETKIERHLKEQFRDWRRGKLTRYRSISKSTIAHLHLFIWTLVIFYIASKV